MNKKNNLTIVFLGLSITSSWGNGHATTFRSLIKGLKKHGHDIYFLERDVPWYSSQRDMPESTDCKIYLYRSFDDLKNRFFSLIEKADCVIVGSYVPEGVIVGRWVQFAAKGVTAFYDIDTPVTLAKLDRRDYEYISPDLIPGFDLYLSFTGGPTLQYIEKKLGSPKAKALFCSFDPDKYYPQTMDKRWDLGYMGTYSADRQPALEELLIKVARRLPHRNFVVAGPMYPADIQWPVNVERIEHLAPETHREFYNSQLFTLNLTRSDMKMRGYSPSVRLFEAAGCAVPVISDSWEGLDSIFFVGKEILVAQDTDDVVHILDNTTKKMRERLGLNAFIKVQSRHTAEHRAEQLEKLIYEQLRQPHKQIVYESMKN